MIHVFGYVGICAGCSRTIDYIIDTVSASHSLDPYLSTLKLDGKLMMVGIPAKPLSIHAFSLTSGKAPNSSSAFFLAFLFVCLFVCLLESSYCLRSSLGEKERDVFRNSPYSWQFEFVSIIQISKPKSKICISLEMAGSSTMVCWRKWDRRNQGDTGDA